MGELASFILYTLIVAMSMSALANLWSDFARARGASERVFELLDREPVVDAGGGDTLDKVIGSVEFDGVGFAYPVRPEVKVLDDVKLRLEPGRVVALVGPSGAGKSTVAAMLLRLYDPNEGVIRLDGHDLRSLDASWLRTQIGTVAQEPVLFSTEVAANIRYGRPEAPDEEVEAAARAANAHDFISNLPERRTPRSPTSVSSGACASPAAKSSAWRSLVPSSRTRPSSSSTKRHRRSTPNQSRWCRTLSNA